MLVCITLMPEFTPSFIFLVAAHTVVHVRHVGKLRKVWQAILPGHRRYNSSTVGYNDL